MELELAGVSFRGPILVTAGYLLLWHFLLVGVQRRTKYRLQQEYAARGETFDRYFGALYPLLLGRRLSKINPKRVHRVTVPSYRIVFYLLGAVVFRALADA